MTVLLIMMLMMMMVVIPMMMAMTTIKLGYSAPDSASRCLLLGKKYPAFPSHTFHPVQFQNILIRLRKFTTHFRAASNHDVFISHQFL